MWSAYGGRALSTAVFFCKSAYIFVRIVRIDGRDFDTTSNRKTTIH
jgi:hypothetical protein